MAENVIYMLAWINEDGLKHWRIAEGAQRNGDQRKYERHARITERRFEQFQRMRRMAA